MKRRTSQLIAMITQVRLPVTWVAYLTLFVLTGLVALMISTHLHYRTSYAVHDEDVYKQNLFFQNNYTDTTQSEYGDYRWIIQKKPHAYTNLMYALVTPLTHTVVSIAETLGGNSFGVFGLSLHSDDARSIILTGQGRQIEIHLIPGKRVYKLLVQGDFLLQFGHWPMRDTYYQQYGITRVMSEQDVRSTGDNDQLIVAYFGSFMHYFATRQLLMWVVLFACVPALVAVAVARSLHPWMPVGLYLIWVLRWYYEYQFGLPFSGEPVLFAAVAGIALIILQRMVRARLIKPLSIANVLVVALMSVMFYQFNALPVAFWRLGVGFDTMPHTMDFVRFLGDMRVPLPIPLISLEYVLYRIHSAPIFDIVYMMMLPRIVFIIGFVYATDELDGLFPYSDIVRMSMLLLMAACIPAIVSYQQQNYIYMYDAMIGTSIVLVLKLAVRPTLTYREIGLLSIGIIVADMMRPFMIMVTPIVVVWVGFTLYRRASFRALSIFLVPLALLLFWHGYHIIVLHQLTWSNYSGYNLARAWYPAAMAQIPSVSQEISINDEIWSQNSAILLRTIVAWIRTHPFDALLNLGWLLWQTYQIPITIARVRMTGEVELVYRNVEWYVAIYMFVYRIIIGMALWGMLVMLFQRLIAKRQILLNALIVTLIVVAVALSENGEQSRFLVSLTPAILYAFIHTISRIVDQPTQQSVG